MDLQIETLFRLDAEGRLRAGHEPDKPPPLFFMGRTRAGHRWLFGGNLPDDTCRALDALFAEEPVGDDLEARPACAARVRSAIGAGFELGTEYRGPAFHFPERIDAPSDVVEITPSNANLLDAELADWRADVADSQPCLARIADGCAVSICCAVAEGPRAMEAGVETSPAWRGKGHARAVVAAWALAVRASGLLPLYSTDWSNAASRGVAASLDLVAFGEDWNIAGRRAA